MALRAPGFGSIDPKITAMNPGKDGPSAPANGEYFEPDDRVIVFIYGKGKKSPVHLTLEVDSPGPGNAEADVKKVLRGSLPPVVMRIGDEHLVFNEGSGSGGFGSALDDRLDTVDNDPARYVIMPVIATLPNSRDDREQLTGVVCVVDFVAVHLDGIVEEEVPDPAKPGRMISIRILMGTVVRRTTSLFASGSQDPSGAGGGTVAAVRLVQ